MYVQNNVAMWYVKICILSLDLALLKEHYHSILHLMPEEYELTVGQLQKYVSEDTICAILSSSSSLEANRMILDCLVDRLSSSADLLDFCDQLENVSPLHEMKILIKQIRSGGFQ